MFMVVFFFALDLALIVVLLFVLLPTEKRSSFMLVLSRTAADGKNGIRISGPATIRVLSVKGEHVRLGIIADKSVNVVREEIFVDVSLSSFREVPSHAAAGA